MATVIKLKRGTTTPTTGDIVNGEVAVDTSAQKLYINDTGSIKEIGGGTTANSFSTISVSGQSDVVADSSTDTLTLVGEGLNSIETDASTDTVTFGTPKAIPFIKSDGTSTTLEMAVTAGTLTTAVNSLHVPFAKADGTDVTTLVLG